MIPMRFLNASVLERKALNRNLSKTWGFPLGDLRPKTRVLKHRILERQRRPNANASVLGTQRLRTLSPCKNGTHRTCFYSTGGHTPIRVCVFSSCGRSPAEGHNPPRGSSRKFASERLLEASAGVSSRVLRVSTGFFEGSDPCL